MIVSQIYCSYFYRKSSASLMVEFLKDLKKKSVFTHVHVLLKLMVQPSSDDPGLV